MSTINALTTKREEIERAIHGYEAALQQARSDLTAITTAIACFSQDPRTPTPPYVDLHRVFERGEMTKLAKAMLAQHGALSTTELAERLMTAKGFNAGDRVMRKAISLKLVQTLRMQQARGVFADAGKEKGIRIWAMP